MNRTTYVKRAMYLGVALARPGQTVLAIGDAVRAGKSRPAIASAFEAALLG